MQTRISQLTFVFYMSENEYNNSYVVNAKKKLIKNKIKFKPIMMIYERIR